MHCFLHRRGFIPVEALSGAALSKIRADLTYTSYSRDVVKSNSHYTNMYGSSGPEVTKVVNAVGTKCGRYISVPRDYALNKLTEFSFTDKTVLPKHSIEFPCTISPRDQKQADFFNDLLGKVDHTKATQILANASTGSGKSVAAIRLGQMLGTPTLIVVDSNKIANGFLKNFIKFYGEEWTKKYVGRVQRDTCDYRGKAFVITLVQSLIARRYPKAMYRYFGLAVFDEVQVYGSRNYHKALGMFWSRVVVGMTATNKTGAFGNLITGYIGKPAIVSEQKVLEPKSFIVKYRMPRLLNVYSDGTLVTSIADVPERNEMLARLIYSRAWKRKRICLVLSERVYHLQDLKKRLIKMGVRKNHIGLHVGEYEDGTYTVAYSYDGSRWIRMKGRRLSYRKALVAREKLQRGEIPDSLKVPQSVIQHLYNKTAKIHFNVEKNTVKPSHEHLDHIANFCHIILATTKIFEKGVDYARIDMGVEAIPMGNVTQALGRTLRLPEKGTWKRTPEWYAIWDRYVLDNETSAVTSDMFPSRNDRKESTVSVMNDFFDTKHRLRSAALRKASSEISFISAKLFEGEDRG